MADQAPSAAQLSSMKVLSHLFASNRVGFVIKAVLLLMSLNWFSSALWEWLQWLPWIDGKKPDGIPRLIIGTATLPALLFWLVIQARNARQIIHPTISVKSPEQVQGLVMYLSSLKGDYLGLLQEALKKGMDLEGFRQQFGHFNWRMPLEAVDHHAPKLAFMVVIASSGKDGSIKQLSEFKALLDTVFPNPAFRLVALEDCFSDKDDKLAFKDGLDFEVEPERLATATNAAYEYLRRQGLRQSEILIDITGGLKVTTVVGSAVALAEGRRIQYVSTRDFEVRVYDVSYEL